MTFGQVTMEITCDGPTRKLKVRASHTPFALEVVVTAADLESIASYFSSVAASWQAEEGALKQRDYYAILDVERTVNEEDIKKAYHRLVHQYHPDKYTDETEKKVAEEKFKEINTAYEAIIHNRGGTAA